MFKLEIVLIELRKGEDDPQLIFESINSTGVDLKNSDLIRNYILMDLDSNEQERLYSDYWTKIEKNVSSVEHFIQHYLSFKFQEAIKKDNVYNYFRKHTIESFENNKEKIIKELNNFSNFYNRIEFNYNYDNNDNAINNKFSRLNALENKAIYPFLLDLLYDLYKNILNEEVVINVLEILESYIFRILLFKGSMKNANKLFPLLIREIKNEKNWENNYVEIFSYLLLKKTGSQKFIKDDEFDNVFMKMDIYNHNKKLLLFKNLENYNEDYNVITDNLTIEHIMPITLNTEWKNRLGEKWKSIHEQYLHSIGNLTLTTKSKNSKMGNKSIKQKHEIDFKESKLLLNKDIDKEKWNEETILKRAKSLCEKAKKIWKYPTINIKTEEGEEVIYNLENDNDVDFSNLKTRPTYIIVKEKKLEVKTWIDFSVRLFKELYEFSPTDFKRLYTNKEYKSMFDKTLKSFKEEPIVNEYICNVRLSANDRIKLMSKFANDIGFNAENIDFCLSSED